MGFIGSIFRFFIDVIRDFASIVGDGIASNIEKTKLWLASPSSKIILDGQMTTFGLAMFFILIIIIVLILEGTDKATILFPLVILNFLILLIGTIFFKKSFSAYLGLEPGDMWRYLLFATVVPYVLSAMFGSCIGVGGITAVFLLSCHVFRLTHFIPDTLFYEAVNLTQDVCTIYALPLFLLFGLFFRDSITVDGKTWFIF